MEKRADDKFKNLTNPQIYSLHFNKKWHDLRRYSSRPQRTDPVEKKKIKKRRNPEKAASKANSVHLHKDRLKNRGRPQFERSADKDEEIPTKRES